MNIINDNLSLIIAIVLAASATIFVRFVVPYLKNKKIFSDENVDNIEYGLSLAEIVLTVVKIDDENKQKIQVVIDACEKSLQLIKKSSIAPTYEDKKNIIISAVYDALDQLDIEADDELDKIISTIVGITLRM